MELTILTAKILALTYLSAGLAALRGKLVFAVLVEDFEKSPALTFITGFITLILGMFLVTYHNIWVKDWPVMITLIGWISLLKGLLLITWPQFISLFKNWYSRTEVWGVLMILLGLAFGYFGFMS